MKKEYSNGEELNLNLNIGGKDRKGWFWYFVIKSICSIVDTIIYGGMVLAVVYLVFSFVGANL